MNRDTCLLLALLCCCAALLAAPLALAQQAPAKADKAPATCLEPGLFGQSLHFTSAGMDYWYSRPDGFQAVTGIPYQDVKCQECPEGKDSFACAPCHANSCDRCHAKGERGDQAYSVSAAKNSKMCMECHAREGLAAKIDQEAGAPDVHLAAGMGCTDCHGAADMHGDGIPYKSMKSPGAVKASCGFCHGKGTANYNPEIKAHKVHAARLDCAACHVSSSMTCYNCHFEAAMKTGEKKGNFIPMKSWLLLVNHNDKVTAGGVQSLVYKGQSFIAYAPQFTHSVTDKPRQCPDCHANEAVKLLSQGQSVPVVAFKDGKVVPWKGVVPAVAGKLDWVFLDKKDGGWVPIKGKVREQWAGFATPLNADQLKRLARPMKE